MTLTEQQTRFCEEYLTDNDATAAAERAGYATSDTTNWGERLLAQAIVSDHIDQLMHEEDEAANKWFIVNHLKTIVQRCMQTNPRKRGVASTQNDDYGFDAASAVKALELLGKYMGMFPNRQ